MAHRRFGGTRADNPSTPPDGRGRVATGRTPMGATGTGRRRDAADGAYGRSNDRIGVHCGRNRSFSARSAKPFHGSRIGRLIGEGLIDAGADAGILAKPIHAERVEILLAFIVAALTKQPIDKFAPWLTDEPPKRSIDRAASILKTFAKKVPR